MSVQREINRIKQNLQNAFDSLVNKGATVPGLPNSTNLKSAIDSIDTSSVTYDATTKTLAIKTK